MVTALYEPESSKIIQKHVEDFEGFGMVRVNVLTPLATTPPETTWST